MGYARINTWVLRERVLLAFGGQAGSAAESGMVSHPRAHESRGRGKWQSSEEREAEMLPPLPAWVFFFPRVSFLRFNSILTLSSQRQHWIPQVKGPVSQDRPRLWMPTPSLAVAWALDGPAVSQKFP